MKKGCAGLLLVTVFSVILLGGCALLPVEEAMPPPPIVNVPQPRLQRTVPVMRGDVVRARNVTAFHVPAREEVLQFDLDGQPITGIYVSMGDYVRAGDLVAVFSWPVIENQLEAALRQESLLRLDLAQQQARHQHALTLATTTEVPVDDAAFLAEINRLTRDLNLMEREVALLEEQNARRFLYAPIDGVVTAALHFAEGMTSNAQARVAVISDLSHSVFEVRAAEAALMYVGDIFTLTIDNMPHQAQVIDPDALGIDRTGARGNEAYLVLLDGDPFFTGRPIAFVHVILEAARGVMYLPLRAIHHTADRTFVYVVDERGLRAVRDVTVGVRGDASYEVISGLEEGELVVNEVF